MTNLNQLLKVEENANLGCKAVSGRNLHEVLGVGRDFTNWIKLHLNNTFAVENEDYVKIWNNSTRGVVEFNGSVRSMAQQGYSVDYILSLDTAKEICMGVGLTSKTSNETKKMSKEIRKYFLECEKQLQQVAVQSPQAFVDSLSLTKDGMTKYLPNFLSYKNADEVLPALLARIVSELDKGLIKLDVLNAAISVSYKVHDAYPDMSPQRSIMLTYIRMAEAKYKQIQNGTLLGTTRAKDLLAEKVTVLEGKLVEAEQDLTNLRTAKIFECGYEDLINAYDTCLIISDMVDKVVEDRVNTKFEEAEYELFKDSIKSYVYRLVKSGHFKGASKYRDAYMAIYKSMGITSKGIYNTFEDHVWALGRENECLYNAAQLCGKYNC